MGLSIGIYAYNRKFYTGTDEQPDQLQIFIKPGKDKASLDAYTALPAATWLGSSPLVSICSGIARIDEAVRVIFNLLKNSIKYNYSIPKSELWNAFKNLVKGIAEAIPLTGIILIVFEAARIAVNYNRIHEQVKEQEGIVGVAVDGKVVVTIDFAKLDKLYQTSTATNIQRLANFRHLCLELLNRAEEKRSRLSMSELFLKLRHIVPNK